MQTNKELEKELRSEWQKYLERSHPEDAMSFIDYVQGLGLFRGRRVTMSNTGWGELEIAFGSCEHTSTHVAVRHVSGIRLVKCRDCGATV